MANRMTDLINKLERRLGTAPLNLPDHLTKDKWVAVIEQDTLSTFSRYYPHKIRIRVDTSNKKNGYYFIDENICDSVDILGVRDIAWDEYANDSIRLQQGMGYGVYDFLANNYGMEDVALLQSRANQTSLFNNGIYLDFIPPNKLKLVSVTGSDISRFIGHFPIDIFIKHPTNLMTISPTMMEIFEKLALADVAIFLFEYLKHYDGLETVFSNVDLKLSYIENQAQKRDEVIQKLEESYVSTSNANQPIMFTV